MNKTNGLAPSLDNALDSADTETLLRRSVQFAPPDEVDPLINEAAAAYDSIALEAVKEENSRRRRRTMLATLIIVSIVVVVVLGMLLFVLVKERPAQPENSPIVNEGPVSPVTWDFKGITFTNGNYCAAVPFQDPRSDLSLRNLVSTGANYVAIIISTYQDDINSTTIYGSSCTDEALLHVISLAHSLGAHVMLKPHVIVMAPGQARENIGENFSDSQWSDWFVSYGNVVSHYASLAASNNVELFSIGTALTASSSQEQRWRALAAAVRSIFPGKLTYAANYGGEETNKTWWDVVDYIGVNAYYPMPVSESGNGNPQLDKRDAVKAIVDEWRHVADRGLAGMCGGLRNLSQAWGNKPIIFTEVGYCSGVCPQGSKVDLESQYVLYRGLVEAFHRTDADDAWFRGVFWWNWASDPAFGGDGNWCMTPQFKPAEQLLREAFNSSLPRSVLPDYAPVCSCVL